MTNHSFEECPDRQFVPGDGWVCRCFSVGEVDFSACPKVVSRKVSPNGKIQHIRWSNGIEEVVKIK